MQLLAPAGDFESAKYSIQNGANAIYFGSKCFSARAFAKNLDNEEIQDIIIYAKLRGVKTYLAINTLIKNTEILDAFNLANFAYLAGISGIIVQDIGFAKLLKKTYPNLEIVCSTQMTINSLNGVKFCERQGFNRVVLARELSIEDISFISRNSNIELEIFGHGALCIGLSRQCLFSSLVGGRSANRGACAGPCRQYYSLISKDGNSSSVIDSGYLLSTKDICSLDILPQLLDSGISSLKIEGRMKSPIYAGTTSKIYSKYLKLAKSNKYFVEKQDMDELLSIFNRGNNSFGHLKGNDIIFKQMPNNSGIYLGKIQNYTKSRYISLKPNVNISIGDKIAIEKNDGSYTISEILCNEKNIKCANNIEVKIGRIKGQIKPGLKVYKILDNQIAQKLEQQSNMENKKFAFNIYLKVKLNEQIQVKVTSANKEKIYQDFNKTYQTNIIPIEAKNKPFTKDDLINRFSKTKNTPFYFKSFDISLDDNVFIPNIANLNHLRCQILKDIEDFAISNIKRSIDSSFYFEGLNHINYLLKDNVNNIDNIDNINDINDDNLKNINSMNITSNIASNTNNIIDKDINLNKTQKEKQKEEKEEQKEQIKNINQNLINLKYQVPKDNKKINISLYPKIFNKDINYLDFKDKVSSYYFNILDLKQKDIFDNVQKISLTSDVYLVFPIFIHLNLSNLFLNLLSKIKEQINVKGFVLSNLGDFEYFENDINYCLIANSTLNINNNLSCEFVKNNNVSKVILNPELNLETINSIINNNLVDFEAIVYGNMELMQNSYCFLGNSNKCYPDCKQLCKENKRYFLKDKLNNEFEIIPDNLSCQTKIYNSKTLSILPSLIDVSSYRVDLIHEDKNAIDNILDNVKNNKKFSGSNFTNGNLLRI